jgi:prepilin-type N-terminal cleavage/methylation domain-containing protein
MQRKRFGLEERPGFTLIELLVVVAVIAILATILFPVATQVREEARWTACLSNLVQIARAGMMYVEDNDEEFPSSYSLSTAAPYDVTTRRSLQPYIKNCDPLNCLTSWGNFSTGLYWLWTRTEPYWRRQDNGNDTRPTTPASGQSDGLPFLPGAQKEVDVAVKQFRAALVQQARARAELYGGDVVQIRDVKHAAGNLAPPPPVSKLKEPLSGFGFFFCGLGAGGLLTLWMTNAPKLHVKVILWLLMLTGMSMLLGYGYLAIA